MKSVGQIVRERREALGLTLSELAQRVGATKSYLSMIENHRVSGPPSGKLIAALEAALEVEGGQLARAADWENTPPQVRERIEQLSSSAHRARELAQWLKDNTGKKRSGGRNLDALHRSGELTRRIQQALGPGEDGPGQLPEAALRRVPLINKVAAGYPSDFTDLGYPARVADDYVACPQVTDPDAFAASVCGESMLPDYREGDVVVFSPLADVTEGCDCFVRIEPDHETTFKRIFFEGDQSERIRLQPLNPKFAPATLPRERVAGLYRAVWKMQRL